MHHRFHLSVLAVELELEGSETAAGLLDAVFGGTRTPIVPTTTTIAYRVCRRADGFEVQPPNGRAVRLEDERDVAPYLEREMYEALLDAHAEAGLAVLHAACVHDDRRTYLVLGDSGAGKSAFARAAISHGFRYFGDEHAFTDGRSLWGLPRAIHLDPILDGAAPLPWHAGADCERYRFVDRLGRASRLPLVPVAAHALATRPRLLTETSVIAPRRGEAEAIRSMPRSEQLTLLGRCVHASGPDAAVGLASLPAGRAITWSDPDRAFAALVARDS